MSEIDVDKLRKLLEAATPHGSWTSAQTHPEWTCGEVYDERGWIGEFSGHPDVRRANASLAASAVNALPALLDEIARLRRIEAAAREYRKSEESRYATQEAMETRKDEADIDHFPAEWPETQAYRESIRAQGVARKALDAALGGGAS